MTARKIKNSWWVDFRVEYTRYRKRSPENTRAGAASYEGALRQRLAHGLPIEPVAQSTAPIPSFEVFAWQWFDEYVIPNNKFAEQRAKKSILTQHLVPCFGRSAIDAISTHQVEQFKAQQLKQGVSKKSLRNRLTILSKCLSCAHDWLELDTPAPKIVWPKCPPPDTDYLSPEECDQLLAQADGLIFDLILTSLRTGMRQGEIKGLQWSSIDWHNRSVAVRHSYCDVRNVLDTPKSNRVRHIPLDAEVFALLAKRRREAGFVFFEGGRPFNSTKMNRRLAEQCLHAGVRRITWHVLRHSFATNAAMRGIPLQIVQQLLGHLSVKTTERYAHVAPSMLRLAIDMLGSKSASLPGQPAGNQWQSTQANQEKSLAA